MKSRTLLSVSIIVACLAGVVLFCAKKSPTSVEEKDFTGTISGLVYSKLDGLPLKDVIVSINADSSTPGVTNASGVFMVGKVAAGTHRLRFSRVAYEGDSSHTIAVSLGENARLPDTVRLSYGYYIIAGKVNNSGTSPVPGAGVAIPGTDRSTLTDQYGDFTLREVPKNDIIKIICAKGGIGFSVDTLTNLKSDIINKVDPISLNREGETVSGTVLDSTGRPMANVVVRAVGGGIVDTTKADGSYTLRNVPSGESGVQITAVGAGTTSGSLTGIEATGGITGADIILHGPVSTINGITLAASNTVMEDGMDSVTLHVYPTTTSEIRKYNWYVKQSTTVTKTTTVPFCTISRAALQKVAAKSSAAGSFNITVWVEAENTLGQFSAKIALTVMVRSSIPEISALGWTAADTAKRDTVRTVANTFVTLKGTAVDLIGGLDTLEWDFGDGSMKWSATDSLPQINHLYISQGTYRAIFRVKDIDKNEVRDTVVIIASAPPIAAPALASPADGDTSAKAGNRVTLVWHLVPGAGITYNVYVDYLNNPPITKTGTNLSDTSLSVAIDSGKTYFWRVESVKGTDKASSVVRSFSSGKTAPVVNHAPQFTSSAMTLTATAGVIYKDTVHATDSDGDPLTFAFKDSVAGMQLRDSVVTWTPAIADTGSKTVSIIVHDGKTGKDTLFWTIAVAKDQNIPKLSALTVSSGTLKPLFNTDTLNYFDTLAPTITSLTVTPASATAGDTIRVNGVKVTSGSASAAIAIANGNTLITIVVKNAGGNSRTYTLTATKNSGSTTLADLTGLGVSMGTLVPAFNYETITYNDTVANSVQGIRITSTARDPGAVIKVNADTVKSDSLSKVINLATGLNTITITVYAPGGTPTKTYTLRVYRRLGSNANLAGLTISKGALTPAFDSMTLVYRDTVNNDTAAVSLTPRCADSLATVKVKGVTVASGAVSAAIALSGRLIDTIPVAVTAQDGATIKTYSVIVVRRKSANADLKGVTLSSGVISPSFSKDVLLYNVSVDNGVTSVSVTPALADTFSMALTVNGTAVKSGAASAAIALTVGVTDSFAIKVVAQDGVTEKAYKVRVTRENPQNALSGYISANRTLTAAESPYYIATGVIVDSGVTLTIDPGVRIKMAAGAAITIDGTLKALGAAGNPITFTTSAAGTNWGYILFSNKSIDAQYDGSGNYTDGSILRNCVVEYGGGATVTNNGAVRLKSASPFICNTDIRNSKASGIAGDSIGQALRIRNCNISSNSPHGILLSNSINNGSLFVDSSTLNNNSSEGFHLQLKSIYLVAVSINYNPGRGLWAQLSDSGSVVGCTINGNSASDGGGGVWIQDATQSRKAKLTLIGNRITNNSVISGQGIGGGLCLSDLASVFMQHNFVAYNKSKSIGTGGGGGIGTRDIISFSSKDNKYIGNSITGGGGGGGLRIGLYYLSSATNSFISDTVDSNRADGGANGGGGGIEVFGGSNDTAVFTDCKISNNSVTASGQCGGGIWVTGKKVVFNGDNKLENNSAVSGGGGGVYIRGGQLTIRNMSVRNNTANWGGGLASDNSPSGSIDSSSFIGNKAITAGLNKGSCGGLFVQSGLNIPLLVGHCRIDSNSADFSAGGIGIFGYQGNVFPANVKYNSIKSNSASDCAGLSTNTLSRVSEISYNIISGNIATGSGTTSAIFIDSMPTFHHNNIENNTATYILYNNNAQSKGHFVATNNWWGSTDANAIDSKIYDYFEDINKSVVDIRPILTAPEPTAGPQ